MTSSPDADAVPSCPSVEGAIGTKVGGKRMKVLGLVMVGVRTAEFDRTLEFFRDVLGVPLTEKSEGFGWSQMPNTSKLEIFGPNDRDHVHFTTGPVPEFLVDDLEAGADELRAAGVELLGEVGGTAEEGWVHFRAPDGNVYGLTSSDSYRR
jgi:catechol 2,3-dioxygenase-like lactoylglutathione lyase family enzyme